VQQPNLGLDHLIVEVSRSHTVTHTYPVGILWKSDQPVVEAATYTTHNKHKTRTSIHTSGFEPAILEIERRRTCALRGHGHRDQPIIMSNPPKSCRFMYPISYISSPGFLNIQGEHKNTPSFQVVIKSKLLEIKECFCVHPVFVSLFLGCHLKTLAFPKIM
jgi:hypothetical protein